MSSSGGERRPSPTMPLFHAQAYHHTTNLPVSIPQMQHQHVGGGSSAVVNQHPRLGPGPPRTRMVTTQHPHRPSGAGPPIHHPGVYAAPQAPPTAHVHQGGGRHLPTQNNSCGTATPMVTRHGGQRLAGQQSQQQTMMLPLSIGSSTVVPAHHQQASRKGPNDALPLTNSTSSSGVGGGGGGRKQHMHHHMDDVSPELFKKVPRSSTKTSQPRQPLPDVLALSSRPPRWTENEVSRYIIKCLTNNMCTYFSRSLKHFLLSSFKDEQLREIVQYLHPQIAESPQIQPEQIRDIHWTQVSDRLHDAKSNTSGDKSSSYSYTRKPAECMRRYTKLRGAAKGGAEKAGASKGPWTDEEDRKVIELVQTHGPKKWSQIASELPGK